MRGSGDTSEHISRRDAFEKWLGPAQKRYFGVGFKQSVHHYDDVELHSGPGSTRVTATARTATWQRVGLVRTEHLGTIDAIAIGATLGSAALVASGRAPAGEEPTLLGAHVKAGTAPAVDLTTIPASADLWQGETANGVSTVLCSVAGIAVELDFVSQSLDMEPWRSGKLQLSELLGPRAERYFADGYRQTQLTATSAEVGGPAISASFEVDPPNTALGIIECLTFTSQMAQVVLYEAAGTRRERTENLWMRRCAFRSRPADIDLPNRAELEIIKMTHLYRGGRHVVAANVRINAFPGWTGTASLAFSITPD